MSTIRKAYASTKHGQIHYAECGEGHPLLLIAETPRSHRFFLSAMPLLARHFRVIAVDTPGFGNSHPLPDPVTIPAVAECLVNLLDALGLDRVNVLGIHTGDKLAAALASGWPARIDRLVLAGYTHSLIPDQAKRKAALQPSFQGYFPPKYDPDADPVRRWAAAHATLETLWWPTPALTATKVVSTDIQDAELHAIDYLQGWRSAVGIYEAVFAFDLAGAVTRIEAPTLVLEFVTEKEEHFGPQAPQLAALMKNATAASVEVTYGSALQTEPAEIVKALLPFLLGH